MPIPKKLPNLEKPSIISAFLRIISKNVSKARYLIMGTVFIILIISVIGVMKIEVNTDVMDFFSESSVIRQSTNVVEEKFGGVGELQVRVTGDLNDPKILQQMLDFQESIKDIDGIARSISIASFLREINEVLTNEAVVPASSSIMAQELLLWQMSADNPSDITKFITLDNTEALIRVTSQLMSSQRTKEAIKELKVLAGDTFGDDVKVNYTGQLLNNIASEDALLKDFLISITLAIILVIIIDSFARSFRAAIVTALVLIITIILQYGFLGYLGINLDLSTMLLGALAIGVGDYAIHLTVRYMEECRKGCEPEVAMDKSILSSGRAIFFTAITLGAGFLPLVFGSVTPIQNLGSFMVFTAVAVGVASLTVLPAACLIFLRNTNKNTQRILRSKEF